MSALRTAYRHGRAVAFKKFALGPPTQVDDFMANVEHGQDVPPPVAAPPMGSMGHPPALDGTMPLQMPSTSPPTPPGLGSTVGQAVEQAPPPNMGALN